MKLAFKRLRLILGFNTIFCLLLSFAATYTCIFFGWTADFPITTVGIAVVTPIVFSIGGAYTRRETALTQYGNIKGLGRAMYFASRDWLRDESDLAEKNQKHFKKHLNELMVSIREHFKAKINSHTSDVREREVYRLFSKLSKDIEDLRNRGMNGSELSRVSAYIKDMIMAYEDVKHIYQYRTPRTIRVYSKIFIYVVPIIYAPYFALLAEGHPFWLGFLMPGLFALIFTCLDNIQEHLENPFDVVGEDDVRINPEKFAETLSIR